MIRAVFASFRAVAEGWQAEAARRRKISATDPVADSLAYCAGELLSQVAQLSSDTAWLSVADFAQLSRVTPQTVRTWIRKGTLEAVATPGGWMIRREARHRAPLRRVA